MTAHPSIGIQPRDIIARRVVDGPYVLTQHLTSGEITLDGGPYNRADAETRARELAIEHRAHAWIEDANGIVRSLN
jgi:hypothetical protein